MQFQVGILLMPNRCLSWICYLRIFQEYQIGGKVPVALQDLFINATSCVDNNMQRSGIESRDLQCQHDGCLCDNVLLHWTVIHEDVADD